MTSTKKSCYIFAAGEPTPIHGAVSDDALVIAADGGFDYARSHGVTPHFVLGDFDSLPASSRELLPDSAIRYPKEKDDTDMMLALKLGLQKGCREFHIYGGLGGRLDHTLANLQSLTYLTEQGAQGYLYGENFTLTVLPAAKAVHFAASEPYNRAECLCSVFSLSDRCEGVTIQGLAYELADATLTNGFPLGVSNHFTGKDAFISTKKGTLAVLWYLS
ncbi:MAG: thiamine diphosphokinase [Eubacterium sp.]|nr:thiamine diphosphokinase [Eubacterium sp.]